jgi:hypothetical protein
MRFATLATACVAALTSVNAQAFDQAYIGVSRGLLIVSSSRARESFADDDLDS